MDNLAKIRLKQFLNSALKYSRTENLFRLPDGPSKSFIDLSKIIYMPEANYLLGKVFWEKMQDISTQRLIDKKMQAVKAVGGLTMAADAISCSIAHYSYSTDWKLEAFTFQKWLQHTGDMHKILGNVKTGDKVVIVEGIVRRSASPIYRSAIQRVIALAMELNLDVVSIVALVDMSENEKCFEALGFRVNSIFTLQELHDASQG